MTVGSDLINANGRYHFLLDFISIEECGVLQQILINAQDYLVPKFELSCSALCSTGAQIYIKSNRHMFWLVYIMVIYIMIGP